MRRLSRAPPRWVSKTSWHARVSIKLTYGPKYALALPAARGGDRQACACLPSLHAHRLLGTGTWKAPPRGLNLISSSPLLRSSQPLPVSLFLLQSFSFLFPAVGSGELGSGAGVAWLIGGGAPTTQGMHEINVLWWTQRRREPRKLSGASALT